MSLSFSCVHICFFRCCVEVLAESTWERQGSNQGFWRYHQISQILLFTLSLHCCHAYPLTLCLTLSFFNNRMTFFVNLRPPEPWKPTQPKKHRPSPKNRASCTSGSLGTSWLPFVIIKIYNIFAIVLKLIMSRYEASLSSWIGFSASAAPGIAWLSITIPLKWRKLNSRSNRLNLIFCWGGPWLLFRDLLII